MHIYNFVLYISVSQVYFVSSRMRTEQKIKREREKEGESIFPLSAHDRETFFVSSQHLFLCFNVRTTFIDINGRCEQRKHKKCKANNQCCQFFSIKFDSFEVEELREAEVVYFVEIK